jgi:hypothetical protein
MDGKIGELVVITLNSLKPMVSRSNFIFRGENNFVWQTNHVRREK